MLRPSARSESRARCRVETRNGPHRGRIVQHPEHIVMIDRTEQYENCGNDHDSDQQPARARRQQSVRGEDQRKDRGLGSSQNYETQHQARGQGPMASQQPRDDHETKRSISVLYAGGSARKVQRRQRNERGAEIRALMIEAARQARRQRHGERGK